MLRVMASRRTSIDSFNGTLHFEGTYLRASMEQAFQRKGTDTLSSASTPTTTTEHSSRILAMNCDPVGKESLASAGLRVVTGLVEADTCL